MEKMKIYNPATNQLIKEIKMDTDESVKQKIQSSHEAFLNWQEVDAHQRAELLGKWFELIDEHKEELAKLITEENGKTYKEALGEVAYANSYIKWYQEEAKRLYGRTIPANASNKKIITDKFPVGVVGAITPWNFPAAMIARKMAPAIAAGCATVCKPANETPLTTIRMVELAHEAGIPKDVIQVVIISGKKAGQLFTENPLIKKITFTGSTAVGKSLIKGSADSVKNVTMELGGLAPVIVHKDADISLAVKQTIATKFRNAGQTCISANRIYVHEDIESEYIKQLIEEVHNLNVGNGMDEQVDMGPLINQQAVDKVLEHIEDAKSHGGELSRTIDEIKLGGNFVAPIVIHNANLDMKVMHEETFGPIAAVMTYKDLDDVIQIANDTEFGLAAYYFTNDYRTGFYLYNKLEYGIIGWNDGGPSAAHAPFGGFKESGYGREGGIEGIEPYLETKYLSIGNM
ncbi:NAD-dependent succinate-semialdehyde dehydrogenase [Mammaliicoccus stepanovicii]|uniref:Succinate-semialdehyde dehydrogenase n=1 Tax=Mammaliicoccus stepanovicii TaxID=643214 RepID=A0A240A7K3_9STAP|nr:NAD-dependent succinate-semialdehyde dehydrogenase [Mammaliicoccus stepanovicii]PNZ78032.1 succinate-semialdehyde dehydrogenase (NADP(+)) [Mammaliicoccus stepanovicii]GGI39605.1 succinate-semialdehyde dehydrogenase [NADP(+)] [Mammaliicoccus stepanovicii]SNV78938.1 succinate-semialdehyde dehydrogenase [Mammaliicoccus stepanovicii]